jgi:serine/threonine-protein kinase
VAAPTGEPIGDPLARYDIGERIGEGSSGIVYVAYEAGLDRTVAIKQLVPALVDQPGFLVRFRTEAETMARLHDPHCVQVYDFVEGPEGAYVVMEYVPGASLRAVLVRSRAKLGAEQSLGVLKGALQGLGYAHGLGLIHRDLKPENVLVDPTGASKLADFGLTVDATQTASALAGTPAYMSPEQVRGEALDRRADLYSAGVVLYEMLTGACPYVADSPAAALSKHALAPMPTMKGMPAPVGAMVEKALAKRPEDRQQSAGEFLDQLEEAASESYGPDWAARASVAALVAAAAAGAAAVVAGGATGAAHSVAVAGSQSAATITGAAHSAAGSSSSLASPAPVASAPGASATGSGPTAPVQSGARGALGSARRSRRLSSLASHHPVLTVGLCAVVAAGAVVGGLAATNAGSSSSRAAAATSPATTSADFSAFAGAWGHDVIGLTIDSSGRGLIREPLSNTVTFNLTSVSNGQARGTVTSATSSNSQGGGVSVGRVSAGDAVEVLPIPPDALRFDIGGGRPFTVCSNTGTQTACPE